MLVFPVMPGDRSVGGFGFHRLAIGGEQYAGHQAKAAIALGNHVRLHVAVVVLAGPDELARPFQGGGDQIVDQAMFVNDAGLAILGLEIIGVNFFEQILEAAVIGLQDGVLRRKIDRPAAIEAIVQAGAGEIANAMLNTRMAAEVNFSMIRYVDAP